MDKGASERAACDDMEALPEPPHEKSHVLVHAADGGAYGYGGRTQNDGLQPGRDSIPLSRKPPSLCRARQNPLYPGPTPS